jgi:hypothetical protein
MTDHETAVINQFTEDRAEVVGASWFFNNKRVSQEALNEATRASCAAKCDGRHELAIQDTTEINYADHDGKLKASDPEFGPVGNDRDVGFFFHPTLAIDAESGAGLKKLCLLGAQGALTLMLLVEGRDGEAGEETAEIVFKEEALRFMEQLTFELEGKTQKQKTICEVGMLA